MIRPLGVLAAATALLVGGMTSPAAAAADETWVSGLGDDVNPCTRTAPCKTFAGAISKTNPGGVIRALDSAGYGGVTITKAITIDATGTLGSALASNTNGIIVNAGANDRVILRGLEMTGGQKLDPACGATMLSGIRILSAGLVHIEDARINLASLNGVIVAPTVNPAKVVISGSDIRNGCGPAVTVTPSAGVSADVHILDSMLSLNAVGISASGGATIRAQGTVLFGNGQDVTTSGGSVDLSDPRNRSIENTPAGNPRTVVNFFTATRTWVSSTGNDVNPCSRTSPCKTVAGAVGKTSAGGQVNVLDGAELGTVTLTKPMTIDGTGTSAQIRAAAGSAITVDVAGVEPVVLRDLNIVGANNGAAGCSFPAASGVRILNARSVHLENSTVSGFATAGVDITPTSSSPRVVIDHSVISNSCGAGIRSAPAAGQSAQTLVSRSTIVNTTTAFDMVGGSLWATGSYLADNTATSTGAGQVTTFPDTVEVVKEVPVPVTVVKEVPAPVVPVAQAPVSCKALPGRLKRNRTTVLLSNTCVTTGGQRVTVTVSGAGTLIRGRNGRMSVKTKRKGSVTVIRTAPATPAFLEFSQSKTYRL